DALPPSTPDLAQLDGAADLIGDWIAAGSSGIVDGSGKIPYPGNSIYRAWRTQVQHDVFDDELGSHDPLPAWAITRKSDTSDAGGDFATVDALLIRAMQGPASPFPTSRDYFANVDTATNPGRDATLVDSLRTALVTLATQFGTTDVTQWLT